MPVTTDITATYRGPGKVVGRLLGMGQREDRALAFLMGGCLLIFVAQLPRLAREAHLTGQALDAKMGGALLGWLILAPLALYLIAGLTHLVARVLGGKGSWYGSRLSLFWALLASTPMWLLYGLVTGFIGPGAAERLVGLMLLAVFGWFWISGLRAAHRGPQ
ncbi:MAG: YIP1 family protein [Marinibacterium sp.]|nr:YIP1 family protein [Marinibacterium sp.]